MRRVEDIEDDMKAIRRRLDDLAVRLASTPTPAVTVPAPVPAVSVRLVTEGEEDNSDHLRLQDNSVHVRRTSQQRRVEAEFSEPDPAFLEELLRSWQVPPTP